MLDAHRGDFLPFLEKEAKRRRTCLDSAQIWPMPALGFGAAVARRAVLAPRCASAPSVPFPFTVQHTGLRDGWLQAGACWGITWMLRKRAALFVRISAGRASAAMAPGVSGLGVLGLGLEERVEAGEAAYGSSRTC